MSFNSDNMQETGPHEITIWHPGMEPEWMIKEILKNQRIVKKLRKGLKEMTLFNSECIKAFNEGPYTRIEDIINELRKLLK